jgi:hypothetical protein
MGIVSDVLVVLLGCLVLYMASHMEIPGWGKVLFYIGALAFFLDAFLDFFHVIR